MLIENVFSLTNIMAMERQCLDHLEFDLVVSEDEVELALISMLRFFANPTLDRPDEHLDTWLYDISPEHMVGIAGDMTSKWFESPQPSFQYLCTRRASAPAILDHPDQPAIGGVPVSYAAFPSDVSDGISSYPSTPAAHCVADLDFDMEELYQEVEVALANVESHVCSGELACSLQYPSMRYPESDMDEYDSQLRTRGRSTHSKPLGNSIRLPSSLGPLCSERNGFAVPAPWVDPSEMPFISQSFAH